MGRQPGSASSDCELCLVVSAILLKRKGQQAILLQHAQGSPEGCMHHTWMAANFDCPRDGCPILNLRHSGPKELSCTLQGIVSCQVQVCATSHDRNGQGLLDTLEPPSLSNFGCTDTLVRREGLCQERQVLSDWEDEWAFDAEALDHMDLCSDRAGDIGGVASNLTVTLHRMHVTEVNATALYLARNDQKRSCTDVIDVHVTVSPVHKLLCSDGLRVGCSDQKGAKVTGVVGIWQRDGRATAKLAHEWPRAPHKANQVMRCEREDGMLGRVGRHGMVMLCIASNCLCSFLWQGHADPTAGVKGHGVAICKFERRCALAIVLVSDRILTNSFNIRLWVKLSFAAVVFCTIWITLEVALYPIVVAGGCRH
mmetsp:Transcript_106216/g.310503  ORF Transcript_106216/g.310503 Transcript_106216/m.310503 type:complete len:368 (+) Transcript_106216:196-1299(+)